MSTSIFLRIVAEYAWEEHNERNVPLADLPPFWRVVEPGTPLSKKLSFDPDWIGLQRDLEKDIQANTARDMKLPVFVLIIFRTYLS